MSQPTPVKSVTARRLAGKTTVAQVVMMPLSAVCSVISTRILLESLGTELFASVALVTGLFLLLPFLDFGTYAEITNTVSDGHEGGWSKDLEARLRTAFRVLFVAGSLTVSLAVLLGAVGWGRLLGAPESSWSTLGPFATAALSAFGLVIILNSGTVVLRGIRLQWLATLLAGFVWPVNLALLLACRRLGLDGIELGLCYPLAIVVLSSLSFWLAMRLSGLGRQRHFFPRLARVRRYRGSSIRAVTVPALIITLGVAISSQLDRYLLAHLSTAQSVADYVVAYQGYAALIAIPSAVGAALWPLLRARSLAGGTGTGTSLTGTIAVGAAIGAGIASAYLLLMPWVFHAVSGEEMPWSLTVAFSALLVAQSANLLPVGFLSGPRGMRLRSGLVWASLACGLPFSILAASRWGSPGPVAVSACAVLICQVAPLLHISRRVATSGTASGLA